MAGNGHQQGHLIKVSRQQQMATHATKRQVSTSNGSVIRWLLELWSLETRYPGEMPVDTDDGDGGPSRWNTLRALRVLDWYTARD
jgi:hypothetical protein